MRRQGCAALLLLCAGSAPLTLDAATSQSFQVSATVTAGCLVVGGVSNYGGLNFGSRSALATGTVQVALTGGVQLPGNQPGGTYSDVLQVQLSW